VVYSRLVNGSGPYLYRSEREGQVVHSIYVGKGANAVTNQSSLKTYTTNQGPALGGPGKERKKKTVKIEHITQENTKLTYLERAHLINFCKKYEIDRAEIDYKVSYEENKEYLDTLAKQNSASSEDIRKQEIESEQWAGEYKDFLENVSEDSEKWRDYF
jgi:hypothetical protein